MKNKIIVSVLGAFWLFSLAQCGAAGGLSSKVSLQAIPTDPVVVNTDLLDGSGEVSCEGPYFITRYRIVNGSSRTLVVANLLYDVSFTLNNVRVDADEPVALDIGAACTTEDESRDYLAIIPPGFAFTSPADYSSTEPGLACAEEAPGTDGIYETFCVDGLPAADNFNYTVEVSGAGWFQDADGVPIERLDISDFISTQ